MLRESVQIRGESVDLSGVTAGFKEQQAIAHAPLLAQFAQAVVLRDTQQVADLRGQLLDLLGPAAMVDIAAVVAAFHGFTRVADAIGIPYQTAAKGQDAPDVREAAGINEFFRIKGA